MTQEQVNEGSGLEPQVAGKVIDREDAGSGLLSKADIRRNMICVIMLDAIFSTGWADISIALQPLLVYLHASNTMIGLVTGAAGAGLFGVIISPWITRHFRYKKWYMFVAHIPYLAALGTVGLGVIYASKHTVADPTLLNFVLACFLAHWFFGGFVSLPHQEYVAAVIPMAYRGRYTGYSFSIGGLVAIGSAFLGRFILRHVAEPLAYGYLFLIAWFTIQSGYIAGLFAKEPPTPVEMSPKPWSKSMLRAAWNDKAYVKLLVMNVCVNLVFIPIFPYVNIYGFKELHMIAASAAVIQIITQIVRVGLSFLIGIATDKIGPKKVLPYWSFMAALSLLPPLLIHNSYGVYLSVALSTIYIAGVTASFTALVYGLPKPEHRAGHFTVQLVVIYIANSLGPILIGRVCDIIPFKTAFLIFACLSIVFFPISKYLAALLSDDARAYS